MEEAESEMQWIEILSKFEILEARSESRLMSGKEEECRGGQWARAPTWT